eukprot:gene4078-2922_t
MEAGGGAADGVARVELSLPQSAFPRLIGRQGATRRDLEQRYGVAICVPPRDAGGAGAATLSGPRFPPFQLWLPPLQLWLPPFQQRAERDGNHSGPADRCAAAKAAIERDYAPGACRDFALYAAPRRGGGGGGRAAPADSDKADWAFYCEACDKGFYTSAKYDAHCDEHLYCP